MENFEKDTKFYVITAVLYAVILGVLLSIFNIFTDIKTSVPSIVIQSICFGIFMSLFDLWQDKRKDRKNKKK